MMNRSSLIQTLLYLAGILFLVAASAVSLRFLMAPRTPQVVAPPPAAVKPNVEKALAPTRLITVEGEGRASATPDTAHLSLSVVAQAPTVEAVTAASHGQMQAIIAEMKTLGIEDKDLSTSQYSLAPEYRREEGQAPAIAGYRLEQALYVTVRNLDQVGDVFAAALRAGANEMGELRFEVEHTEPLQEKALTLAVEAAHRKAQALAQAAQTRLGNVLTLSEGTPDVSSPYPHVMRAAREPALASPPPIETGEQTVQARVQVTYSLE